MKTGPGIPPGAILLRAVSGGETKAAALRAAHHNLVLSFAKDDEIQAFAKKLKTLKQALPGVVGPSRESESFFQTWKEMTGTKESKIIGQKLMKLTKVIPPKPTVGKFRRATKKDLALLTKWMLEFAKETLPENEYKDEQRMADMSARIVTTDRSFVWEVDGKTVSMAAIGRQTRGGVAVFGVYTPKEFRKRGFASAVVAQLSEQQLKGGREFCVLYTDASNPTSNKIYQDIGYKIIGDSKYFAF